MNDRTAIRARLAEVRQRIDRAGQGRPVTVVGVTKAFGPELIDEAVAAGLTELGENYAQELAAKVAHLGWTAGAVPASPRFHFIGGLQRNKVKRLAPWVSVWQTIDREALVDELASRSPGARLLLQVNTTGEPQKSGCGPDEVEGLAARAAGLGLDVAGLMTVGPTDAAADPRPSFELLRTIGERLALPELSMGMSADYEIAVAEGATMVRLGSVLFGSRPPRPKPSLPDLGGGN